VEAYRQLVLRASLATTRPPATVCSLLERLQPLAATRLGVRTAEASRASMADVRADGRFVFVLSCMIELPMQL
jgi:hypothetical protein